MTASLDTRESVTTTAAWTEDAIADLGVRTDLITAGAILGIGRTKAHELARQGQFPVPVLRIGARYVVPTAPLRELLRLTEVHPHAS